VPLLENASLENSEELQDKWANMIANMADSENNLQNQIFPYLLSQISIQEYEELKELSNKESAFRKKENNISQLPIDSRERRVALINHEIEKLNGYKLNLKEYEKANLTRLGLIRQLPPRMYIEEFSLDFEELQNRWYQPGIEMDVDDYGFRLNELGERFLLLCEVDLNTPSGANL